MRHQTVTTRRTEEPERDPDARRPLTDAMTWGERQRMWMRVYKRERDRFERERDEARQQLAGAVAALRELAAIHHNTLAPSRLHDPHNRDWTECECRSCRLAQPFGGQ